MSVRGDFEGVRQLARAFGQLSYAQRRELHLNLAEEARHQVHRSFETSTSPWGRKWRPIKHRKGQPLRDTGRLMNSFSATATGSGFVISTNVVYARIHNRGGSVHHQPRLHKRRVDGRLAPDDRHTDRGLPGKKGRTRRLYSSWHRGYAINIPARPFVPTQANPGRWAEPMREIADLYLKTLVQP